MSATAPARLPARLAAPRAFVLLRGTPVETPPARVRARVRPSGLHRSCTGPTVQQQQGIHDRPRRRRDRVRYEQPRVASFIYLSDAAHIADSRCGSSKPWSCTSTACRMCIVIRRWVDALGAERVLTSKPGSLALCSLLLPWAATIATFVTATAQICLTCPHAPWLLDIPLVTDGCRCGSPTSTRYLNPLHAKSTFSSMTFRFAKVATREELFTDSLTVRYQLFASLSRSLQNVIE